MQTGKISMRQAMGIYILILGSTSIRILPLYSIQKAGQVAWLTPFLAAAVLGVYFGMIHKIFSRYEEASLIQILEDIFGKWIGKLFGIVYFLYLTALASGIIRGAAERLTESLSINTSHIIYCGIILLFLSYVLKYDLPNFARLCEILLFFVVILFVTVCILAIPKVKIENFYPISYLDFVPVLKGAMGILAIWGGYITMVFAFSDRIRHKKQTFQLGVKALGLLTFLTLMAISVPLGVIGKSTEVFYFPFTTAIQSISLFNAIERVEAIMVAAWIMTDFALIGMFIFSALSVLKCTFKLSDYKPFLNIYSVMLFFLSLFAISRVYELNVLAVDLFLYGNIFFGLGIPLLLFLVGKMRKKI